jgi:hypothetical protein
MREIDKKLLDCPLKHDIRVTFWIPFIQRLQKNPIRYLTLYSPPLMDVKLLHSRGLIEKRGEKYVNVVGVTDDPEAFSAANSELDNRLEHLIFGDINELLAKDRDDEEMIKQLKSKFPFDVINLDYTNYLHRKELDVEISPHISAIDKILTLQRKGSQKDFILLLTTRAETSHYNRAFLRTLSDYFVHNQNHTPHFAQTLSSVLGFDTPGQFLNQDKNGYFVVSLSKYILTLLKDHHYDMVAWDIRWLIRDQGQPVRHLLHLAFHVTEFVPPRLLRRGLSGNRSAIIEHRSVDFIRANYPSIAETADRGRLEPIYSAEIRALNRRTFENETPQPIGNE